MTHEYLPQFRRQLHDWLQFRLASGRTPFQRVEECPPVLTGDAIATPDLILWINRDSLLAGAMIVVPRRNDPQSLAGAGETARAIGLQQFTTWDAREVNIWNCDATQPERLKSWSLPDADTVSVQNFAVVFEQLLLELKNQVVAAALPPARLPFAYFANLCRQVLDDTDAALQESARLAARPGQPDAAIRQSARDKGWLTLWRVLALRWHDRFPPGIDPERLDRALDYALSGLEAQLAAPLAPSAQEAPLPESAAIRFHHLAGRLAQLAWNDPPERALDFLRRLLAEAVRENRVATTPIDPPPGERDLLVNHLPAQPLATASLVAPFSCLAGRALVAALTNEPLPGPMVTALPLLPSGWRPTRIVASLSEKQPLTATQRRQQTMELRRPWPNRRFDLPANSPAWLWEALYLGGLPSSDGVLQLTLPPDWVDAPGATELWQEITERLVITGLAIQADGSQTLILSGPEQSLDCLAIRHADGTTEQRPLLLDDAGLETIAALTGRPTPARTAVRRTRRPAPPSPEELFATAFRDGIPRFPEDYLRRIDAPARRGYQLPGLLHHGSQFFDQIRLAGEHGAFVECDNQTDAEALLLAAHGPPRHIELPVDQSLTLQLIGAYRSDLARLWQSLLDECRRHHPRQRTALTLAHRLWREHGLPPDAER